jgi:alkylhydroperoxidase/carboxymuconolactone decarboxylase family protein YurZ
MSETDEDLPALPDWLRRDRPQIWRAYQALGEACSQAGPLDGRTKRLVKLALAMGGRSEGAVHSHARRALAEGLQADDLRHVALLAIPTIGFPQAMAALSWIEDITDEERKRR